MTVPYEVPPGAESWMIIFHRRSARWVEMVLPGRFKHVSAAGFIPQTQAWIILSWELGRLRVGMMPDAEFDAFLSGWCLEGDGLLRMKAPDFDQGPVRPRFVGTCTGMISHILGLKRGALRPDRLWHVLLENGAEIYQDGRHIPTEGTADAAIGG